MKKVIQENKVLFVLAVILLISFVLIVVGLVSYFYGGDTDPYGNRLDGIEDYPISKNIDKDIMAMYEDGGVLSVDVDVKGKIVYVIMDVKATTDKVTARSYATKALTKFSDEEKNFYDIHFTITCDTNTEENKIYPMMGSKSAKRSNISWTNN